MALADLSEILKERYPEAIQETRFCSEHGEYQATSLGPGQPFSVCPDCRVEKMDRETLEGMKGYRETETKRRLEQEIPKRFQGKTFENFSVDCNIEARKVRDVVWNYAKNFRENLDKGRSLLLVGNPGTGKNHLAISLVRVLILNGFTAQIMDAPDLVYRVKSTWNAQGRESEGKALWEMSKLDLLVINELGALFKTEAERRILFRIINRRYEDLLPTFVIGNVTREEAKEILGAPTYDRLKEGGGQVLVLNWESYRDPQ